MAESLPDIRRRLEDLRKREGVTLQQLREFLERYNTNPGAVAQLAILFMQSPPNTSYFEDAWGKFLGDPYTSESLKRELTGPNSRPREYRGGALGWLFGLFGGGGSPEEREQKRKAIEAQRQAAIQAGLEREQQRLGLQQKVTQRQEEIDKREAELQEKELAAREAALRREEQDEEGPELLGSASTLQGDMRYQPGDDRQRRDYERALARMKRETAEREKRWAQDNPSMENIWPSLHDAAQAGRERRMQEVLERERLLREPQAQPAAGVGREAIDALTGETAEWRRMMERERPLIDKFNAQKRESAGRMSPEEVARFAAIEARLEALAKETEELNKARRDASGEDNEAWKAAKKAYEDEIYELRKEQAAIHQAAAGRRGPAPAAPGGEAAEELSEEQEKIAETLAEGEKKTARIMSAGHGAALAATATGNPELAPIAEGAAAALGDNERLKAQRKANEEAQKYRKKQERWEELQRRREEPASNLKGFLLVLALLAALFGPRTSMPIIGQIPPLGVALLFIALIVLFGIVSPRFRKEFLSLNGAFFFAFILLHVVLAHMDPEHGFPSSVFMIGMIVLLTAVAALLFIWVSGAVDDKVRFVIVLMLSAAIIYSIPALATAYLPQNTATIITGMVLVMPLPALVILSRIAEEDPEGYADRMFFWYKVLFFILFIAGFLLSAGMTLLSYAPQGSGSSNTDDAKDAIWDRVVDNYAGLIEKGQIQYRKATDPGAYYTGQVEKNKDKKLPLGVTITGVRPADKIIGNRTEMIFYSSVTAKSFVSDMVTVTPTCVLDKKNSPAAWVDPHQVDILYGTHKSFECTFNPVEMPNGEWPKGTYTVTSSVTFPFETWVYMPVTFVDEERVRALQGKDVRQVFGIQENPPAVFTAGPIQVGMGGTPQPILLSPEDDQIVAPGTFVGITIANGWDKGELQRVDTIELKVPRPFSLSRCDRNWTGEPSLDANDEQYTNYRFVNPNYDPVLSYTSITCQLNITADQREAAMGLVQTDKAERSFIGIVNYTFTVREKGQVQVQ